MARRHCSLIRKWAGVGLAAPLAAALLGCGGKSSSPTSPGTPSSPTSPSSPSSPTGSANYDGSWRGTTSQSLPITFTVAAGVVTAISVDVRVSYAGVTCTYTTGSQQRPTISGNSFTISIGGGTVSTMLRGTFSSAGAASGTIDSFSVSGIGPPCGLAVGTPVSQGEKTWQTSKG